MWYNATNDALNIWTGDQSRSPGPIPGAGSTSPHTTGVTRQVSSMVNLQGQSDNFLSNYHWSDNFSFHPTRFELSGQPLHTRVTLKARHWDCKRSMCRLASYGDQGRVHFPNSSEGWVIHTQLVLEPVINSKEQLGPSVPQWNTGELNLAKVSRNRFPFPFTTRRILVTTAIFFLEWGGTFRKINEIK